jgi:methylated-DNA-[protein]-cysteine S-methyltransferase
MYYDFFETGLIGTVTLVADENGLRRIDFHQARAPVCMPEAWQRKPEVFDSVKSQLSAYFLGELRRFDIRMAVAGTAFQLAVWHALRFIPYGELASYKTIAEAVGKPKAFRAVGGAVGKNPVPIIVPCHRVIGSDGSLTGFGGGLDIKQRLIDLEASVRSEGS